jgi:hypothetical protein
MVGGSIFQWFRARPARAAAAAVVFVGLSGGAAYATTHDSPGAFRQALVADAAKRLGVTPAQLTSALQQAQIDQINKAVTAGKLTRAQGDAIIKGIKAGHGFGLLGPAGPPVGGFHFHARGHFGPMHHGPGGPAGFLSGAATYLGVSNTALFNDLRSGKTLADVAKTQGKSVTGLEQAMLNASKTRLDGAVKKGFMTKQQEQQFLAHVKTGIDTFVTKGFQFHGHGGPWHAPAPMGGGKNGGSTPPKSTPTVFFG